MLELTLTWKSFWFPSPAPERTLVSFKDLPSKENSSFCNINNSIGGFLRAESGNHVYAVSHRCGGEKCDFWLRKPAYILWHWWSLHFANSTYYGVYRFGPHPLQDVIPTSTTSSPPFSHMQCLIQVRIVLCVEKEHQLSHTPFFLFPTWNSSVCVI